MEEPVHEPKNRVATGTLAILAWIALWVGLMVVLFDYVAHWPALAQMPLYLVAGLAWVIPLKPVLRWMETGNWR